YRVALVLLALILAGFVVRVWCNPRQIPPAFAAGSAAAFCLWLGIELFFVAVVPAILVLASLWARGGAERLRQNLAFAAAFAAVTTAALLIDTPYAGLLAVEVDRLSAPYQCFTMLVLLAWTVLWFILRWNAAKVPAAWPHRLFCGLAIAAF